VKNFVLDTSALLTFIEKEEGFEVVEALLLESLERRNAIYVSVASFIEIFYISAQEQGIEIAINRTKIMQDLVINIEPIVLEDIQEIGLLKSQSKLSFADSCIAGLALIKKATLVHKDPEFEMMPTKIEQKILPYKTNKS